MADIDINNPVILHDSLLISAFDVSNDIMIFSQWDSNKISIFNFKNKKIEFLYEFEPGVTCSSISFLKSEGNKFLFIALSNGKMLFYKLKSKHNYINYINYINHFF